MPKRRRGRPADSPDDLGEWLEDERCSWDEGVGPRLGIAFSGRDRSADEFTGPSPADLDRVFPLCRALPSAHFGSVVEQAPPRYRGWLLHLIRQYLRDGLRLPAFWEALDRDEDFHAAWLSLPPGDLRTTGYFLEQVGRDGLLLTILREIDYRPFKWGEPEGNQDYLRRILPAGGFASVIRDALTDPDPACRLLAILLSREQADEEGGSPAAVALAPLLSDPVREVRWEAALQLWNLHGEREAHQATSPTEKAILDVLEEALAANPAYLAFTADYREEWRNAAVFLGALCPATPHGRLPRRTPGLETLPGLLACLRGPSVGPLGPAVDGPALR